VPVTSATFEIDQDLGSRADNFDDKHWERQ
jgi:hypothetical protein